MGKKKEDKLFHEELIHELVTLFTSGFGLAAAFAWNEAIKEVISTYIIKYFPIHYGIISKFIYAILITTLGVFIAYQLSKLVTKWGIKK